MPPEKLKVSVALLPKVKMPVLLNTVGAKALVTFVVPPSSAKL